MTGFRTLRKQLDELGYYQPLVIDAVPLVEALFHDLLTTTHNLKLCSEQSKLKDEYQLEVEQPNRNVAHKAVSKPSASSTPLTIAFEGNHGAKIIRLESRLADLENLNRECNLIIQRQQVELDEKSKEILKLELSSGNPRAKVVTQNDRPLIISESLKPRIELTRLIDTKERKGASRQKDSHVEESETKSDVDLIKMYERRNRHLDNELAILQSELDKARKLLTQAEKQWNCNTKCNKYNTAPVEGEMYLNISQDGQTHEAQMSSYMIKLLNDNNRMKASLAEIDQHSRICFHGKVIPPVAHPPPCCCGHAAACRGECTLVTPCCQQHTEKSSQPLESCRGSENIRSMVETSHAQLRQNVCIASRPSKVNYHETCQQQEYRLPFQCPRSIQQFQSNKPSGQCQIVEQ